MELVKGDVVRVQLKDEPARLVLVVDVRPGPDGSTSYDLLADPETTDA